jgi:hypothetical protein
VIGEAVDRLLLATDRLYGWAAFEFGAVVYVLVTLLIVRLRTGEHWVRLALTVLLGVVGLTSLLAEPISWSISGGAPAAFLATADAPTVAVVALRAVHVVAVVCALSLMYSRSSNKFFR